MACVTSKCCFCVPLRPGLLTWAYIKLALAVVFFVFTLVSFLNILSIDLGRRELINYFWVPIALSLVYIVFSVVFVIGMHHGSYKLLLVYYRYSMFEILVGVSIIVYQVFFVAPSGMGSYYYRRPSAIVQLVVLILGQIVLPVYFIIVLRSELLAIEAKEEVEETRVVSDIPLAREQDRKYDFVYANAIPESQGVPKMPLFPVEELERLRQQLGVKHV